MRELDLTPEETIEYSKLNSSVVQPSRQSLNPYYLGLKIFEDIERRWDRDKMFEVRELDSDISFIRSYLSKELVNDLDLYVFEKKDRNGKLPTRPGKMYATSLCLPGSTAALPTLLFRTQITSAMANC